KPAKKFTDRKTAVTRIWQAIQKLAPAAQQGAQDAPLAASASKAASSQKGAPKTKKGAKEAKPKPEARDGSKKARVIDMLKREKGATNEESQKATDWQPHSIRGFISGNLVKKMGLKVETIERENGARAYHIA
ncbi:MAG: DUF3489 domain-containing protein, partial [Hyphomicrobiaceae bacterium]